MRIARTLVLPGLGALLLAWTTFRLSVSYLVEAVACRPDMSLQPGTTDLVSDPMCVIISANTPMYFAWMATLPFAGALAAALARRADASSRERLMAALFPAFALAIETALLAVISGFFWRIPVYWVLMPAVMCVLGAVPFLLPQQRGPVHDHVQT